MVTKNQIAQLSARIDALADQLGLTEKPTYRVWLSFTGESDEEFYARFLTHAAICTSPYPLVWSRRRSSKRVDADKP